MVDLPGAGPDHLGDEEGAPSPRRVIRAFERLTLPLIALDAEWRCTYANAGAGALLDRQPGELLDKVLWAELPAGAAEALYPACERAMRDQRPVRVEASWAPDGRRLEELIFPAPDGVTIQLQDLTQRERVGPDANLAGRLAFVLDNVSDVIFQIGVEPGPTFRFSWVNRRFLEVTGLREEQVVGVLAAAVIPAPAHALVFGKYQEAIRTGQPARWEEISRYPGGEKTGLVTVVPVPDPAGVHTRLVGMVHDITERKAAEERIRTLNGELRREAGVLEQRVRDRTAELAERNQELKDFAHTISHDLKAPLRGIAGYASELQRKHREGLDERGAFCVSQILRATTHLDQLIEDLLRYARLDSETPSLTAVDLRKLVGSILHDRELTLGELGVEVNLELPAGTARLWERGLSRVMTNLIDNAIKYSQRSRPPRIWVTAEQRDGAWRFSVRDNGIGFDLKHHDRVFKLFHRLVRMEEYEGTGAGLAIAKKTLEKQGGRIWADAHPGRGATFFVELPTPRDSPQET